LFVGEEVVSEEFVQANFGGAISEWASAPPVIALVAKTRGAKEAILLCHEKVSEKFCHRQVFAAWFEEHTGEVIEEVR